jgi:Kef-type K+ transport system membrane component KefB
MGADTEQYLFNLFGISVLAFGVPFVLGFFPRLRVPAIVLEIVAGIVVGPQVLGLLHVDEVSRFLGLLGVAFLLFLAGVELDLGALRGKPLRLGMASFAFSFALAAAGAFALHAAGVDYTPLLVAVALCSTSVGIVVPVLRDTHNLDSDVGRLVVAGGAVAEFASIALLGVLFAVPTESIVQELLVVVIGLAVLAVFVGVIVLLGWGLRRASAWQPGKQVTARLDLTTSQISTRFVVVIVLGAASIAAVFGFEIILGTFLAGILFGALIRGSERESLYGTRLDAIGFGFFVPIFFITSGMRLDIKAALTVSGLLTVLAFFVILAVARGVPALLFRGSIGTRGALASGLMLATNVSFVVVAADLGVEAGLVRSSVASSMVLAGLISAVLFPALSQSLLARRAPEAGATELSDLPKPRASGQAPPRG